MKKTAKNFLLGLSLSLGLAGAVHAQALDIGGIELRLGQSVPEALRLLASYNVQYGNGSWVVFQKQGRAFQALGSISAKGNAITAISKTYDLSDVWRLKEVYAEASRDLHKRGGAACTTRETVDANEQASGFETQCLRYRLVFVMPFRMPDGASGGGMFITTHAQ